MATMILSLIIFGSAGYIIYHDYLKKDRKSQCSECDCPAKPKH